MVWQNITSTTRVKGCPFGGLRKRTSGLCASATGRVPKFFCLSASRPAWISRGSAWSWGAIIWRRWVPLFCCPGIFSDERCDHRQRPMAVPLPALDRWLRCRSGRCAAVSLRPMAAALVLLVVANALWALLCMRWALLYGPTASLLGVLHLLVEALFVGTLALLEWRWRAHLRAV